MRLEPGYRGCGRWSRVTPGNFRRLGKSASAIRQSVPVTTAIGVYLQRCAPTFDSQLVYRSWVDVPDPKPPGQLYSHDSIPAPPLRLISRLIVDGARPRDVAIERTDWPATTARDISSRSAKVRALFERRR